MFSDALVSAPLAQKLEAPILLVRKNKVDITVNDYVAKSKSSIDTIYVQGGPNTISKSTQDELRQATTYLKVTKVLPFETINQNDSSLAIGQTKVIQNGVNGSQDILYDVTYVNGKETNRKEISRQTKAAISKVIKIGKQKTEVKTETKKENVVAYSTVTQNDSTLPKGQTKIMQAGSDGYDASLILLHM